MDRDRVTALFVAGPEHGKLRELPEFRDYVMVPIFEPSLMAPKEDDALLGIAQRTAYYQPLRIALFGKKANLPLYVFSDPKDERHITERKQEDALADLLLSPLGKELRGERLHA